MATVINENSRITSISLFILAGVAIAAALAYTRAVMVPFVLAIFLSYLVSPVVDRLEDRARVPRLVSTFLALLVGLGLLALLVLLVSTSIRGLLASADIYSEKLAETTQRIIALFDRFGVDIGQRPVLEAIQGAPLGTLFQRTLGTVVGTVGNASLVVIFLIFLVSGRRAPEHRTGIYQEIDTKIRRYLLMKVATSATTGVLVGLILTLFGLDLALVFGMTAFLLNFIPSIGSIVATLLPLPMALVQFDSALPIILIVVLPGAVQMVIGNGIEPLVMGEGLDLHPVTILLALIFWGLLWGIVGMLLAAPMTAVLRIALARTETTRPLAELLAGRLPDVAPSG